MGNVCASPARIGNNGSEFQSQKAPRNEGLTIYGYSAGYWACLSLGDVVRIWPCTQALEYEAEMRV